MFQARLTVNDAGVEKSVLIGAGKAYEAFAASHNITEHHCPGRNCNATVFPRRGKSDHFVTNVHKETHMPHCAYDASRERGKGTVSLSHALENGLPVILNINIKSLRRELPDVRSKKEFNAVRDRKIDSKDYATYSVKDIRDLFSFLERRYLQQNMTGIRSPVFVVYKKTIRSLDKCFLGEDAGVIGGYLKAALKRTEHAKKRKGQKSKSYAPSLPMMVSMDFQKAADKDGRYYSQPFVLPSLPSKIFLDDAMRNAAMMPHVIRFALQTENAHVAGAVDYALASGREIVIMAAPEHDIRSAVYGFMYGHKPKEKPPALPPELSGHRQLILPVKIDDPTQLQTFKIQSLSFRG